MNRTLVLLRTATAALAQTPPVEVWAVPSVYKVRPNEPAQATNLVCDKQSKTLAVAGVKTNIFSFRSCSPCRRPTGILSPLRIGPDFTPHLQ